MIDLLDYLATNGFTSYIASGGDRDFMRPVKPVRISEPGRAPADLAAGNSNGDIPMLRFAGGPSRPGLGLLVLHDDARARVRLRHRGRALPGGGRGPRDGRWSSIRNDWSTVFDG